MVNYLEVYFRNKGSVQWSTARGIFDDPNICMPNLFCKLLSINPNYEFKKDYLLFEVSLIGDLGTYELSELLSAKDIKKRFGFTNRNDLGWKNLNEITEEIFVPTSPFSYFSYTSEDKDDIPF